MIEEYLIGHCSPTLAGLKTANLINIPFESIAHLEDTEFEPMFESCKPKLNGKNTALFGSYGWGGGGWMNTWEDDCKSLGANLIFDSIICNDAPDEEAHEKCEELGKVL